MIPALLVATGVLVCMVAVRALHMVMANWHGRVAAAHSKPMGHVVWRSFDTFAVALWSVLYVIGGLSLTAGLFVLGR